MEDTLENCIYHPGLLVVLINSFYTTLKNEYHTGCIEKVISKFFCSDVNYSMKLKRENKEWNFSK